MDRGPDVSGCECPDSPACGTPYGYRKYGCRGDGCVKALRADQRRRDRAAARPDSLPTPARVPTAQVRTHLAMLRANGLGYRRVAELAGLRENTVWLIATGRQATVKPPTKEALMAVMPSMVAPGALVDAGPVRLQIDALYEAGVTELELAELLHGPKATTLRLGDRVTGRVADLVAVLCRELLTEPDDVDRFFDPLACLRLIVGSAEDRAWRRDAECARLAGDIKDRNLAFFPTRGEDPLFARAVCRRCPVQEPCLDFALETNEIGLWGDTTGGDRREIRAQGLTAADVIALREGRPDARLLDLLAERRQLVAV